MTRSTNVPKLAGIAGTILVALVLFSPTIHAALLGLNLTSPFISFNTDGTTTYDPSDGLLKIDASSQVFLTGEDAFLIMNEAGDNFGGDFTINVQVNTLGALVGGDPDGDDLEIKGMVLGVTCLAGPPCPTLLTGRVLAFGSAGTDLEFRIQVTGGELALMGIPTQVGVRVSAHNFLPPSPAIPFTGSFGTSFLSHAEGTLGGIAGAAQPTPIVSAGDDKFIEATGPDGAIVAFIPVPTATNGPGGASLPVTCTPGPGPFPIGSTMVTCSATNGANTGSDTFVVKVQDTRAPELSGGDIEVQATGPDGAAVPLAVTASDLVTPNVVVTCSPASDTTFAIGLTTVTCHATDAAGNISRLDLKVTVKVVPPAVPGDGCFILDFREITYFKGALVIMSSNAEIRTRNGIAGVFNPSVWPYRASGGSAYTTSRGTLFRVYGFQPAELGREVQNADVNFIKYLVKFDNDTKGYYIDLGGPARVVICDAQLHEFVLTGKKGNGHKDGSTLLPVPQRNVPGVMLTHNAQIVKVPNRVRWEMYQLGLNAPSRGLIDYIGFQLQGNGSATYREFVDVEVSFPGDSATDRKKHYASGFHTATNTNFETFAGCSYLDSAPGNDAVRLRDVWGPNRSRNLGYWSYLACGTKEPAANQRVRANYEVPFNAIQILPTVNTNTDTLRMFYGAINPISEREKNKKDHKSDWEEWDRWDH